MSSINPKPPGLEPTDDLDLYAKALAISLGASKQTPAHEKIFSLLYWFMLFCIAGWFASMALDRDPPVRWTKREIVNPNKQVRPGEQIRVEATRTRHRLCELTKRYAIVDGGGRRLDFEPEHYDAYGPITTVPETDITGPTLPLDAATGRGRLITTLAWDCNVLQRATGWSIVVVQGPLEFEILPRAQ